MRTMNYVSFPSGSPGKSSARIGTISLYNLFKKRNQKKVKPGSTVPEKNCYSIVNPFPDLSHEKTGHPLKPAAKFGGKYHYLSVTIALSLFIYIYTLGQIPVTTGWLEAIYPGASSVHASDHFALLANLASVTYTNAMHLEIVLLAFVFKQFLSIWYGELLLTGFCGASLLIYVRHVYDRKKEKMAYHNRLLEMQAKALTNQMNPHFIYNSLSTVQHLIMIDEKQKAFDYISDFSLLMRQMLTNTRKSYISLDDEVDFLKRYLELEKIRFINAFQYEFYLDEDLRSNSYCIPSMLIQPILENAIKHGFSPKRENNLLKITMVAKNDLVICSVDDNGIGWKKKNSDFSTMKHESTALTIMRERLNLIKSYNGNTGNLEIIDKFIQDNQQTGTIVKIHIPIINSL